MNFRPLNDRLLIKREAGEEKTAGGIIIPDNAKEKPMMGKVVAAGEGKHLENGKTQSLQVKSGDKIFFRKYAGTDVQIDGIEYMILREDEVLAVVEG